MQPVDVLVGIHLEQRRLVVDLRRRGVLDEHRVDGGVVVERADRREQIGLRRVLGKVHVRRGEPDLVRLLLLHADVARARAVVAHEDGAETGCHAVLHEPLDARLEIVERGGPRPGRPASGSRSMQEVPLAGEHHRETELVGLVDHGLVAHPAARAG